MCLENGKAYVGQSKDLGRRLGEHRSALRRNKHRNQELQRDYNQYGADAFEYVIVALVEDNLDQVEADLIERLRSDGKCYNVFSGGLVGYTANQEFREKISRAHKGRVHSEESRARHAAATRRQWQNPEYRETMLQSVHRQWQSTEYRQIMHDAHFGNSEANGHKLNNEIVRTARQEYADGASVDELAEKYGVKYCAMNTALRGRSWRNA